MNTLSVTMPNFWFVFLIVGVAIGFTLIGAMLARSWSKMVDEIANEESEKSEVLNDLRPETKIVYISPDIEDSIVTPNVPDWKKASN